MTGGWLFIAPGEPSRWQRLLDRWRRWRWRKHGGLCPRWQSMGLYDPDSDR